MFRSAVALRQYALVTLLLWAACCVMDQSANAAIVHDELDGDGELSNDNNDPTPLDFAIGDNTVRGVVFDARGTMNTDIFTFTVPELTEWTSMRVDDYISTDNIAFVAISSGTTFPYNVFDLDEVQNGNLPEDAFLGGTTFGPGDTVPNDPTAGFDILQRAGRISGSRFSGPLSAGEYTVYIQQIGASTEYRLTFGITSIPEPSAFAFLGLASGVVVTRRRRR
ncbi:MAG: PEP-CTERM sorting domain-containing protein [Planctomycetota bacterium]